MKTKSEFVSFIKEEVSKILKESKYSSFKIKKSAELDEVGKFYVIKKPKEGSLKEDLMFESNMFDLHERFVNHSLMREDIGAIVYNENRANNRCESLIKEFDKNLKETWKSEVSKLTEKCNYFKNSLNNSKRYFKDKLTEDIEGKHQRIGESIVKLEERIKSINDKIKSYKRPVKEDSKGGSGKTVANKKKSATKSNDSTKSK